MKRIGELAQKVRSKNAGPFWITIDIFCGSAPAYRTIRDGIADIAVAAALGVEAEALKRFDIPELNVVKFSAPRPAIQGTAADRDMHGAGFAVLVAELDIDA